MKIDFEGPVHPHAFPFTVKQKLECITEFHPWFSKEGGVQSPWGRAVIAPEMLNAVMLSGLEPDKWPKRPEDDWLHQAGKGATPVGLFGGCEVVIHEGPVFYETDYELSRQLVGKGETKPGDQGVEFQWMRTFLTEKSTGKLVAEMTLQNLSVKSTFRNYKELRAKSDTLVASAKL